MEGMAWRESVTQRNLSTDDAGEPSTQTSLPVIVDDVSQFDVAGLSDMSLNAVSSSSVGNGICMPPSSAVNVSHINYELVGIVVHSGQANAGHYYSFIKDRRYGALFCAVKLVPFQ